MRYRSPQSGPLHAVRSLLDRIVAQFQAAAFWAAVVLPVGYTALLVGGTRPALIALMLVAHVACLLVGHPHRRDVLGEGGV